MAMYESVIITNSKIDSDKILTMLKNELWSCNVNTVHLKDMGIKNLAYKVKGHTTGRYWELYFETTPARLQQWEKILKTNDYVLKFMSLLTEPTELEDRMHGSIKLDCSRITLSGNKFQQPNGLDVLFGRAEYKPKRKE